MGMIFSNLFARLFARKKEMKILIMGISHPGKTTILYKLKLGQLVPITPTGLGFNLETLEYKNLCFSIWDISGGNKSRPLWKHYFQNTQGLIYVVDSNDREDITEAGQVLANFLLDKELKDIPLLVFATKQDLPDAMSIDDVTKELKLNSIEGRHWHIQGTTLADFEGLHAGFHWLCDELVEKE